MDNEKKKVIEVGKKVEPITQLYLRHFPIIDPSLSLDNIINSEVKKRLLPKRRCALKECNKEFRPSSVNECCCTKEHFDILKKKHKE